MIIEYLFTIELLFRISQLWLEWQSKISIKNDKIFKNIYWNVTEKFEIFQILSNIKKCFSTWMKIPKTPKVSIWLLNPPISIQIASLQPCWNTIEI